MNRHRDEEEDNVVAIQMNLHQDSVILRDRGMIQMNRHRGGEREAVILMNLLQGGLCKVMTRMSLLLEEDREETRLLLQGENGLLLRHREKRSGGK